jgi:hypothetical protein
MSPEEEELAEYAFMVADRDNMVRRAHASGLPKRRISELSGLARMTVSKILADQCPRVASQVAAADTTGPPTAAAHKAQLARDDDDSASSALRACSIAVSRSSAPRSLTS